MPLANPITCTSACTTAKLPTTRARCRVRRRNGFASFSNGGDVGPKKLIGGGAAIAQQVSSFSYAACASFPQKPGSLNQRGSGEARRPPRHQARLSSRVSSEDQCAVGEEREAPLFRVSDRRNLHELFAAA